MKDKNKKRGEEGGKGMRKRRGRVEEAEERKGEGNTLDRGRRIKRKEKRRE